MKLTNSQKRGLKILGMIIIATLFILTLTQGVEIFNLNN